MTYFTFVKREILKEFLENGRRYGEIGKTSRRVKVLCKKKYKKRTERKNYNLFSSEERYGKGRKKKRGKNIVREKYQSPIPNVF
jgi:hypothetical protein